MFHISYLDSVSYLNTNVDGFIPFVMSSIPIRNFPEDVGERSVECEAHSFVGAWLRTSEFCKTHAPPCYLLRLSQGQPRRAVLDQILLFINLDHTMLDDISSSKWIVDLFCVESSIAFRLRNRTTFTPFMLYKNERNSLEFMDNISLIPVVK